MKIATKSQYYRKEKQVQSLQKFLAHIANLCYNKFVPVNMSDLIRKEFKVSKNIIGFLEEAKMIEKKGLNEYKWIGPLVTSDEKAEELLDKCLTAINTYQVAKRKEKSATNPSTIQIGTRKFIRVIDRKPLVPNQTLVKTTDKPKEQWTLTEEKTKSMLNQIKGALIGLNIMDWESFVTRASAKFIISFPMQYALFKTGTIKQSSEGFKFIPTDVNYDLVRSLLNKSKEWDQDMNVLQHVQQMMEPKKEEPKTTPIKPAAVGVKANALDRYHSFIHNIYVDLQSKKVSSLSSYCVAHRISKVAPLALRKLDVIFKQDGLYYWNDKGQPTVALAKTVLDWVTNSVKQSVSKEVNTFVKDTFPAEKKAVNTPKSTPVVEDTDKVMTLAEKFTALGNYEMAEKLLDQMLCKTNKEKQ